MSRFAMRIEEMLVVHHRVMKEMVDHRMKLLTRENAAVALGWSVDKLRDFETQMSTLMYLKHSVSTYTILDMYRYIALIDRKLIVLSDEQYEHLLEGPVV